MSEVDSKGRILTHQEALDRSAQLAVDKFNLAVENERLREALGHYADKGAWTKTVLDSYSGDVDIFDWDGDLADEPWEIAEKALREESGDE